MGLCASRPSADQFQQGDVDARPNAWHQPPPSQCQAQPHLQQPLYQQPHQYQQRHQPQHIQPPPSHSAALSHAPGGLQQGQKPSPLITAVSTHAPGTHHEVLWFPDQMLPCRNVNVAGGCRRGQKCMYSHTATSLSSITLDEISNLVIAMHKRGVRVRVITDNKQMSNAGNDIQRFRAAGIEVRSQKKRGTANGAPPVGSASQNGYAPLMHHKFCLVDGHLLVNGSFNWSRMAVLSNQENVVIQDAPYLVQEFSRQFECLWQLFSHP